MRCMPTKAIAFSGGKDSMACLHLMRGELNCAIFVDAGYSFPETLAMVDYAETIIPVHRVKVDRKAYTREWGIASDIVPIDWTHAGHHMTTPKNVMVQSYLQCCFDNIAMPLVNKAKEIGVTHLVYGQRNEEGHKATSRDGDLVAGMVRLHPIEDWSSQDVLSYLFTKMAIPTHYAIEHSSLDCYDCAAYRSESRDKIAYMKQRHPEKFSAYEANRNAINDAIRDAA